MATNSEISAATNCRNEPSLIDSRAIESRWQLKAGYQIRIDKIIATRKNANIEYWMHQTLILLRMLRLVLNGSPPEVGRRWCMIA